MDLRQVVRARMEELGVSRAELCRMLVGRVKQRTLYGFFEGDPMNAASLGHVFGSLGLGVYPHEWVSQTVRDEELARVRETLKREAPSPNPLAVRLRLRLLDLLG